MSSLEELQARADQFELEEQKEREAAANNAAGLFFNEDADVQACVELITTLADASTGESELISMLDDRICDIEQLRADYGEFSSAAASVYGKQFDFDVNTEFSSSGTLVFTLIKALSQGTSGEVATFVFMCFPHINPDFQTGSGLMKIIKTGALIVGIVVVGTLSFGVRAATKTASLIFKEIIGTIDHMHDMWDAKSLSFWPLESKAETAIKHYQAAASKVIGPSAAQSVADVVQPFARPTKYLPALAKGAYELNKRGMQFGGSKFDIIPAVSLALITVFVSLLPRF